MLQDIFYSRKNFMQPDKQHGIHRTFENEVEHLDTLFKSESSFVSNISCVKHLLCQASSVSNIFCIKYLLCQTSFVSIIFYVKIFYVKHLLCQTSSVSTSFVSNHLLCQTFCVSIFCKHLLCVCQIIFYVKHLMS
jgi:hypothetical protein